MNVAHLTVDARPTAVIAERTTWEAFPSLWPALLDEVWSVVRPRRSEIAGSFAPVGRVIASTLPAGRVVTAEAGR